MICIVILMLIYNEVFDCVFVVVEIMVLVLVKIEYGYVFDWFIFSDIIDFEVVLFEE